MSRFWVVLLCLLSMPALARAQARPTSSAMPPVQSLHASSIQNQPPAAYSKEPFVIERYATTARFENDGTGEQVLAVRVHVQSDAGAQQLHELVFRYDSANQQMEVRFVRVHKADGTTVNGAADAVTEVIAPTVRRRACLRQTTRKNTLRSRRWCRETRSNTKSLPASCHLSRPANSGIAHTFLNSAIVRDERLEISVPGDAQSNSEINRQLPLRNQARKWARYLSTGSTRILPCRQDDSSKNQTGQPKSKSPDVQLTTFRQLGGCSALVRETRAGPQRTHSGNPREDRGIDSRENRGTSQRRKRFTILSRPIFATWNLPLGQDGWQPHSAAEVLSNKYGDSADKHILLAAMLKAAGIPSDAVLIPYTRKLDTSVPSPAQFDHVITGIAAGTGLIWMDSTAEVAPFRLLASPLRNKSALLVAADGAGKIVETPADPPFLSTQHVDIDGHVSDLGKLAARAHYSMRGDTELVLRLAFHRTPQAQWNDLGQTILSLDGIRGEVTA